MIKINRGPCPQSLINSPTTGVHYNKDDVVDELWNMQHGKCCYCEQGVERESLMKEVEHFRPKGLPEFEGLINDWGNLLLSCRDCNGTKRKKFPKDDRGEPLLIDPSNGNIDPEDHLDFHTDFADGLDGQIFAKNESVIGKTTIDNIKLYKSIYVHQRREHLGDCIKALIKLKNSRENTPSRSQAISRFNDLLAANSPFAALTRSFARKISVDKFGVSIPSGYE